MQKITGASEAVIVPRGPRVRSYATVSVLIFRPLYIALQRDLWLLAFIRRRIR